MNKNLKYLVIILFTLSLLPAKRDRLTGDGVILKQEPYSIEEINKLEELYDNGNLKALETLINIYKDNNQIYSIRLAALDIIKFIDSPLVINALQETIQNSEFIELEFFSKTLEILSDKNQLESTDAFITGLANSENMIIDLRIEIIDAISQNGTEDAILTLIDLYEISQSNYIRMNELISLTLGNMDDDRSIPILMKIAQDKSINIRIRNQAVEILSKKNAPELVDFFIEMLGDPETNEEMLTFINNTMGDIYNDRLVMALVESFETGKNRYFATLHSVMASLENYTNPQIKPAYIEVALTEEFPRLLRIKAIQNLGNFNDPAVLDDLIPMLGNPENYIYYFEILNLANTLNVKDEYMDLIRNTSHHTMLNNQ